MTTELPAEPSSTQSLWARMAGGMPGIGPIFTMLSDPKFQASVMTMMNAMADNARRAARIEAKLDIILREGGHDVDALNAAIDAGRNTAALPAVAGSVGGGSAAPAGSLADDGGGGVAAAAVGGKRGNGDARRPLGGA